MGLGYEITPDSKVHVNNMGPTWGRQDPRGPHVGHMNLAIRDCPTCHTMHLTDWHHALWMIWRPMKFLSCWQIWLIESGLNVISSANVNPSSFTVTNIKITFYCFQFLSLPAYKIKLRILPWKLSNHFAAWILYTNTHFSKQEIHFNLRDRTLLEQSHCFTKTYGYKSFKYCVAFILLQQL